MTLEERYAPGRRENSFFVDMPAAEERKAGTSASGRRMRYTYYIDSDGNIVREKLYAPEGQE